MWKLSKLRSWSKHTTVAKMGRSLSIIKRWSAFLTTQSTRQVLVLSLLDYCSVVWSGATEGLRKIAIGSEHESISLSHVNLSWLKVEERLTSSLLVLVRGIDMLKAPSCLFKQLAHSSDTHVYPTRHATRGLFTVPKSRTDYGRHTVLHRAMTTWNYSIFHIR